MPSVLDPIDIRGVRLRNRTVMPAMTTRLAAADGAVTEALIRWYEARAGGGTGLVTIEMASPHPAGRHRAHELGLCEERFLPGLRELTTRVRRAGAAVSIQIGHAGGHTREDVTGHPPVAPSAIPHVVQEVDTRTVVPRALTRADIDALTVAFADAADRAKRAGFDMAEIHGAHGYLIAQFLSPLDNHRTDEYGGSLANRARFAVDVVRACRARVGDFPLIFRVSADDLVPGGVTLDDAKEVCRRVVEAGADVVSIAAGCYRSLPSPAMVIPPMRYARGLFLPLAAAIKAVVDVPVIAVGLLHDPALAERAIASGQADLIALGRQLIADPEWARKVQEKRPQEIRPCIACNTCVEGMREGAKIGCLVNPTAGAETAGAETAGAPQPATRPRRVVVVGAGPAGMEAARLLAMRGHHVVLFEAESRVGGGLRLAAKAPMFQGVEAHEPSILALVDFLERELRRTGVELRVGERATAARVSAAKPDVIVVATGARYRAPFGSIVPRLLARPRRAGRVSALMSRPLARRLIASVLRTPDLAVERELRGLGIELRRIGDCRAPRKTADAMREAAALADAL